jgi:hypothetical protein
MFGWKPLSYSQDCEIDSRYNKWDHKSRNRHIGCPFMIHVETFILKELAGFDGAETDVNPIFSDSPFKRVI